MDATLYDDLVSVLGELNHVFLEAKRQGDWALASCIQMSRCRLLRATWRYEDEHRVEPQVQLSLLARREGRHHDVRPPEAG